MAQTIEITISGESESVGEGTAADVRAWRHYLYDYISTRHDGADVRVIVGDTDRTRVRAWSDDAVDRDLDASSESLRADVERTCVQAWASWLAAGAPGVERA